MFFQATLGRVASRVAAGLVVAAALASCGGGTYQVKAFVPARILTFGDEGNLLVLPQGLKYSVNGLSTETNLVDCALNPLWDQVLANNYGMVYAGCNSNAVAQPTAISFAALNATVDDTIAQVQAFLSGDSFNSDDMVTIWVGEHDVLTQYTESGGADDQDTLVTDMRDRGAALAGLVNSIANAGAKVILLTIPSMNDSPFAYNENQRGDFDRATLLGLMSDGFNRSLRSTVINDGSKIGLVLVDDYVQSAVRNPGGFRLVPQPGVQTACPVTSPLPDCDDSDVINDATLNSNLASIYLWADDIHLAPTAQQQIGNQAVSRATTNPF